MIANALFVSNNSIKYTNEDTKSQDSSEPTLCVGFLYNFVILI